MCLCSGWCIIACAVVVKDLEMFGVSETLFLSVRDTDRFRLVSDRRRGGLQRHVHRTSTSTNAAAIKELVEMLPSSSGEAGL